MNKKEHGAALKRAISLRGLGREVIADATGVKARTVTNWTSGGTMPSEKEKAALRSLLGPYDAPGDEVELALERSTLTDWRRDAVKSEYRRHLHEQRREESA